MQITRPLVMFVLGAGLALQPMAFNRAYAESGAAEQPEQPNQVEKIGKAPAEAGQKPAPYSQKAYGWFYAGNLYLKDAVAALYTKNDIKTAEGLLRLTIASYDKAVKDDSAIYPVLLPNLGAALLVSGEAARLDGRLDEALAFYRQAEEKSRQTVELRPNLAGGWVNLGMVLARYGSIELKAGNAQKAEAMFAEAEIKFGRATRIDPNCMVAWYNWACLDALRGNMPACVSHLEACLAIEGQDFVKNLDKDKDFDFVRDSKEFKAFMEKARKK